MSTTSETATALPNPADESTPILSVNMTGVTKLTTTNYLSWSLQIRLFLGGHDLQDYINDSASVPDSMIPFNNTLVVNPKYTSYLCQDQLIFASEVQWISSLLAELGISMPAKPVIYCDNVGATYLCANPIFHTRMKHVAVAYHHIRNLVQNGTLRVSHVSSADQLADGLTKPLSRACFLPFTSKIGLATLRPS